VTVVGYASADRSVLVDAFPAANGTALVRRRLSAPWPRLGGCGPQIAGRLAVAGVPVDCVTWVADDGLGRAVLAQLERDGAGTTGVLVAGSRTAESFIVYDAGGASACFYDPGDAHRDGLTARQRVQVARAELLCLTVAPAGATRAALEAVAPDARVVWSVKADPDAYPPELVARLRARADVVAFSAGERAFVTAGAGEGGGRPGALEIETRGADGVRWTRGGESGCEPVRPVAVSDTTGAGDALVAGVIAQLLRDAEDVAAAIAAGIESSRGFLERRGREE
jgi:ribokinase